MKKPRDHALKLRHRFSRRAVLIGAAQTGLFGLLLWRLRQLQILDTSDLEIPASIPNDFTRSSTLRVDTPWT